MSSVTDCRVFRGFDAASDHHLLELTLRLRLSAAKQQGAPGIASGRYNVARLQRCKPTQVEFEMDLHNRFSTLADAPQQLPDPETEWARLKEAAQQAAATAISGAETEVRGDQRPLQSGQRCALALPFINDHGHKCFQSVFRKNRLFRRRHSVQIRRRN